MLIRFYTLVFCSLSFLSYSQHDSTDLVHELTGVEITGEKLLIQSNVAFNRKSFLTLAGSLEDPTRLMIKEPGITTQNDQANSIIYHGMPSQYHRWSMYGASILNPNHQGNAGTITDLPSRTAGGVNMLSGQVIGNLEFQGRPSLKSLDAMAAKSDIRLREAYKNSITTNLSLIGLEVGIDRVSEDAKRNLIANYRYSTVGALIGLGLDFGGEEIDYQDFNIKNSWKIKDNKLSVYASVGLSSNFKEAFDTDIEEYKDLQLIDFTSNTAIFGLANLYKRGNTKFENTINFSLKNSERNSIENSYGTFYSSKDKLFAMSSRYSKTTPIGLFFVQFSPEYFTSDLRIDYPGENKLITGIVDDSYFRFSSSIGVQSQITKEMIFTGNIGINGVSDTYVPVGTFQFHYHLSDSDFKLSYQHVSQAYDPELRLYLPLDQTKTHHFALDWNWNWIGWQVFFHDMYDLPYSNEGAAFSSVDNLDYLPFIDDGFENVNLRTTGTANIYGTTLAIKKEFNGFFLNANMTLLDGTQEIDDKVGIRIPLQYEYIFNITARKEWFFKNDKTFGISTSIHHREGQFQNSVSPDSYDWGYTFYGPNLNYDIQLTDYIRADLRLYYKPSKRSTISLDIQNVTNRENDAYYYYEPFTKSTTLKKQLGMIPILSWRVDW